MLTGGHAVPRAAGWRLLAGLMLCGLGTCATSSMPQAIADSAGPAWRVACQHENPAVMWRGMMGTDGRFDAVWVNRASGEVVRAAAAARVVGLADVLAGA